MAEQLLRLSPHRDLQCYFLQPSAIAAMSNASATGFTLSGSWRTQWDWAVVEWNRDNGFDHPLFRYLPDLGTGDLSGVTLSYVEQRTNCIPIESNIYPSLDWPYLRLWVPKGDGTDQVYYVRIADYATPVPGSLYQPATVTLTLTGSVTTGKRVGLAFMGTFASPVEQTGALIEQHCYFNPPSSVTTLSQVAAGLANSVNQNIKDVTATAVGNSIICKYVGAGALSGKTGENGNRVGVYGYVQWGSNTGWAQQSASFSGGQFPSQYQITLPFGNLQGVTDVSQFSQNPIPYVRTQNVRKVRWMWAADLQPAAFQRAEFQVTVSQWTVTDSKRVYSVSGPGSRRIEDLDPSVMYSTTAGTSDWSMASGNYSAGRSHVTTTPEATCTITYSEAAAHRLYLGTRRFDGAASISVSIDSQPTTALPLALGAEDILIRVPLGSMAAGTHTVVITNTGTLVQTNPPQTASFYFDFLEIAYPSQTLPDIPLPDITPQPKLALATDWDTLHSQALPAERTAWMISKLGFTGRVNHYVGALWWYELTRPGQQFPSVTATISAPGNPTGRTSINFGGTLVSHLNIVDDTSATIAIALAQLINQGTTSVWASASENVVTITWRFIETDPANPQAPLPISSAGSDVPIFLSATALQGGTPGNDVGYDASDPIQKLTVFYRTDLTYPQRINRACRDWSAAFFAALKGYDIDCVATFSAELAHVDPTAPAGMVGMAQRYPNGSPVILSTPAVQTNFSPASLAFWQGVYTNMAALQSAAGMVPYLQSGEVQWWYFAGTAGMPYYDLFTTQQFTAAYGSAMGIVPNGAVPVAQFPREASLLQNLLGNFTAGIRTALRTAYPNARYEVLYPGDVNSSTVYPFNAAVNLPVSDWTPQNLTCFKTEGLAFALPPLSGQQMPARSLDASLSCLQVAASLGFSAAQRSHLVGISDAMTAWNKEVDLAIAAGMESVVLFALDQYCLIGYPLPPFLDQRWSKRAA